jgi:putative Ca2+/H+ antiporter (TMEM165/GDT1 family)
MIMAMKYNKVVVFLASIASLILMTVLSCAFGSILPLILSKEFSDVLAMILFFVFGAKLLYDSTKVQNVIHGLIIGWIRNSRRNG